VVNYFAEKKGERRKMKKIFGTALIIAFLLPLALMAYRVTPANATLNPEFFVLPVKSKFYAPCMVSTNFDVKVELFNDYQITGKKVYAFDFYLWWFNSTYDYPYPHLRNLENSMISLVSAEVKSPWDEGKYFIVKKELINDTQIAHFTPNWVDPQTGSPVDLTNEYYDGIHVAITAMGEGLALESFKGPVLDLTFHIDDEPGYPDIWFSPFKIVVVAVSDCTTTPVTVTVEDGMFEIVSSEPEIGVVNPNPYDGVTSKQKFVQWINDTQFTAEVWVWNVTRMYDFDFYLFYPSDLLKLTPQDVHIKDTLPPPYQEVSVTFDKINATTNYVHVIVERPCTKPPITICGGAPIVNFYFTTMCWTGSHLPKPQWGWITVYDPSLGSAYEPEVSTKGSAICPADRTYKPTDPTYKLSNYDAKYFWIPQNTDLDQSGHTDIVDLSAVAKKYGVVYEGWNELSPAGAGGVGTPVDLFDIVVVAKKLCKPYTPDVTKTGPFGDLTLDP
jgi:hypothetical protein